MRKFKNVNKLVNELKPDSPVYCVRPDSIKISTEFFINNFPGKVLYAVKTNPNQTVLKHIISNGINNFDTASISEIKLIRKLKPDAHIYFMHTVKSRNDIKEAYFNLGIRDFALDTKEELIKHDFDLSDLTSGIYFISMKNKYGLGTKKLILK